MSSSFDDGLELIKGQLTLGRESIYQVRSFHKLAHHKVVLLFSFFDEFHVLWKIIIAQIAIKLPKTLFTNYDLCVTPCMRESAELLLEADN